MAERAEMCDNSASFVLLVSVYLTLNTTLNLMNKVSAHALHEKSLA